jgi:diacylglycerol kinase family enzyme
MRRQFFVVVNAGAGVARSPLFAKTVRLLQYAGASVECKDACDFADARTSAREAALSDRYDVIVAAGGDGTIRHVAAAMLETHKPLGILPVGTANVLAHEIGLATTPQAIMGMLLEGPAVPVACARANGEPFLLMAGAGFDARVVNALNHHLKSRLGKVAYAGPVLGALVRPIDALTVVVDGRHHVASWVVVANARHYGGRFVLAPRTGVRERGLEAILFKARTRAVLISQLASLVLGRLDARAAARSDVEVLRCSRVSVNSHNPVPTQIDGDVFGSTPLQVEDGMDEVQLIVPAHGTSTAGRLPGR